MVRLFVGELLGTFMLSATLNLMTKYFTEGPQLDLIKVVFGLFVAIKIAGKLSGAHLNPGISLTFTINDFINGKVQPLPNYLKMLAGQIVGAFIPPIICSLLKGQALKLTISPDATYLTAFVAEFIGCVLFYSVVLLQSKEKEDLHSGDESISGLIVALSLGAGAAIAGNISGAGLNPAIGTALNTVGYFWTGYDSTYIKDLPIYIFAPILASAVANVLVIFIFQTKQKNLEKKNSALSNCLVTKDSSYATQTDLIK